MLSIGPWDTLTGPNQLRALLGASTTLSWLLPFWEKGWFRGKTLQHATRPRVATHLWNFLVRPFENHGETIGPAGPMGGLASSHCAAISQTAQRHGQRGTIPRLDIDRCLVDLEDLTQTREHVLVMTPCERFHCHWIDASECVGGPRSCTVGLTARRTTVECGTEFDASPRSFQETGHVLLVAQWGAKDLNSLLVERHTGTLPDPRCWVIVTCNPLQNIAYLGARQTCSTPWSSHMDPDPCMMQQRILHCSTDRTDAVRVCHHHNFVVKCNGIMRPLVPHPRLMELCATLRRHHPTNTEMGNRRTCAQMEVWKHLLPPVPALSTWPCAKSNRKPPTPSINVTVADCFKSQSLKRGQCTRIPPGSRVRYWCGAVADLTAGPNCWAIVRATNRRITSPLTMPRTLPSGFERAVISSHHGLDRRGAVWLFVHPTTDASVRTSCQKVPPRHLCEVNEGFCQIVSHPTGTTLVVGNP